MHSDANRDMRQSPDTAFAVRYISTRNCQMPDDAAASILTLEIDRAGNVAVVRCRGRLVSGVGDTLHAQVSQLIPDSRRIVLDLTDLTHMDSMGLGTVVRLYVTARSAGCDLELINLGKRIRHLLGVTNLLSVFTIIGEHRITII
jgi:anti-sigma B factor antagonist